MTETIYTFYQTPMFYNLMIIVMLWDILWKALALWRAARNGNQGWYIFMIILNTVGILPIIYLLTHKSKNPLR